MCAVDPGVDDRDLDTGAGKRRQRRGPEVEGVVLLQVPLPRRERVVRRERGGGARCDGAPRECEEGRGRRGREAPHPETTSSGLVVPGTKPRPGVTRAR